MKLSRRGKNALVREAAEWTEILKHGGSQERAAFEEWLTESPRHVREFLLMSAVDRALDSIDAKGEHDVQTLLAQARKNAGVTDLSTYQKPDIMARATQSRRWYWMGIAAAVALVASGAAWWYAMPQW